MTVNSASVTSFVPSGSPAMLLPDTQSAVTAAMPIVDGSNLDVTVQNTGGGVAWISFAAGVPVGPDVPSCIVVPGGATVLLTTNAATLAAAAANPGVMTGQNGSWATATQWTAKGTQRGAALVIQRGTATSRVTW